MGAVLGSVRLCPKAPSGDVSRKVSDIGSDDCSPVITGDSDRAYAAAPSSRDRGTPSSVSSGETRALRSMARIDVGGDHGPILVGWLVSHPRTDPEGPEEAIGRDRGGLGGEVGMQDRAAVECRQARDRP